MNELEVRAAIIDARERSGDRLIARAIEDGDVEIIVRKEAWL